MREKNTTVKTIHSLNFFSALWVSGEVLSFHQGSQFKFFLFFFLLHNPHTVMQTCDLVFVQNSNWLTDSFPRCFRDSVEVHMEEGQTVRFSMQCFHKLV